MNMRRPFQSLLAITLAATLAAPGCFRDSKNPASTAVPLSFQGTVLGATGDPVAGATVYLIPSFLLSGPNPINADNVLSGAAEAFDEPLEDLVRNQGNTFVRAVTGTAGNFLIATVPDGRYYVFVQPAAADTEHLPGGSWCRESVDAAGLRGRNVTIKLSSSPSTSATYVGMVTCLLCHPDEATEKTVAHRLGFKVPGEFGPLQDPSVHPEIDDGLAYFLDAADYTGGTPVYLYDFDPNRGFDKFKTSLTDPRPSGGVLSFILWLWRDTATGKYMITLDNVGNTGIYSRAQMVPGDPNSPMDLEVALTYGGAVFKQRYMVKWPGRNGLYPVLQFQHAGDESRWDRTRRVFRDYHLDFYVDDNGTPTDVSDDLIRDPDPGKNIQLNCMGCHATGYTQYVDAVTGERLCDSVELPEGEYDIDGDGLLNVLNTGCETCHGPGSDHVAHGGGRYIVTPDILSPSRENLICMRCHDRQEGNGTVKNDHPLNPDDEFPLPGISRAEYLQDYVVRPGPKISHFWTDGLHSKKHHQQGPDLMKSMHWRNPDELLACSDCHHMHGGTGHEFMLLEDPDEPDSPLCMRCHAPYIGTTFEHTLAELGVGHGAASATCVKCHMPKAAKTGAGEYGYLLGPPTGTSADDDLTYFVNDISSHVFDVPRKNNPGVAGVQPAKAMPIPYTNSCGTCHDPSSLPYQ